MKIVGFKIIRNMLTSYKSATNQEPPGSSGRPLWSPSTFGSKFFNTLDEEDSRILASGQRSDGARRVMVQTVEIIGTWSEEIIV